MLYFSLVLLFFINICYGFELITMGIGGIGSALGLYNFNTIKEYSYCKLPNVECCTANSIPADIDNLKRDLQSNLYGQHIIIDELIPALRGHFQEDIKSRKPLVISFHGTPGTGKNYVSDYIAKHIYKNGLNSKFVHKFGKADFALESKVEIYKEYITRKIFEEIRNCPRSLFVFDEIDKIPRGVFESITTFLDFHDNIKGIDFSKAIFLFLSNTAGREIGDQLHKFLKRGQRTATKLHDFEAILEAGVYSLTNGLQRGGILDAHLIDHFLPFLPLEKQHVKECIYAEYRRWNVHPTQQSIDFIFENYVTYEDEYNIFSVSGCKRLGSKVKNDVMTNYKAY